MTILASWFPSKLKKLKTIISLFTMDDDYSTINYCSLPYTKYYDYHFHVWVMFDKQGKTIADKLKEYGGNPIWIPYWYFADHLNSNIDFYNRDIDICYIWNINPPKLIRLSKLKRHFWDKLKLFWQQWNWDRISLKWIFYKITNKIFRLWYIEPVSDEKLKEIYKRTKIWFNLHLCPRKWPSNLRLYELPANWVMEICDNDLWMRKIFNVGKEIITYKNISEAITKIEYYLQHEEERIQIAKQWYKKTINNYSFENNLKNMFDIIFNTNK